MDRLFKIGEEDAIACQEAPIFDNYSNSDDDFEPFLGTHPSLTITTMRQGKGIEPSELRDNSRFCPTFQTCLIKKASPSLPLRKKELAIPYQSTTPPAMTSTPRSNTSSWPQSETPMKTSTPMNSSRTSPLTSSRETALKTKMGSTGGHGG